MDENKIRNTVKEKYGRIAKENTTCCPPGSCCNSTEQAKRIGYSQIELDTIPEGANMSLGCGNPTALADIREGETVLDLGSGGGPDCFLASEKVGPKGYVIGVDMTQEMISKANSIAKENGYKNLEFRLGEIENLPVKDNTIDLIISNCVINLSPDKLKTYKEAYRALKPGGRIMISDVVTEGELPEEVRKDLDAWAGCVAGALEKQDYLDTIRKAGFEEVRILSQIGFEKLLSIQVRAYKPKEK